MSSNEKFCTGCQRYKKESEGKLVERRRMKRWICSVCLDRKNVSVYAKKRGSDAN